MEMYKLKPLWQQLSKDQHESIILKLMDQLEVLDNNLRMKAARTLLYLAQGCWVEVQSDEEQQSNSRYNVMMLYRLGVFEAFVELLNLEIENATTANVAIRKIAVSLADSIDLRVILSVLYIITEVMRAEQEQKESEYKELVDAFVAEISQPMIDELLAVKLLGMITRFCSGSAPHFPMKKVLLLLWKVSLVSLGGTETLKDLKSNASCVINLFKTNFNLF
jgi:N1221-like protein